MDDKRAVSACVSMAPREPNQENLRGYRAVIALVSLGLAALLCFRFQVQVVEYPDLYEASIMELQNGLDKRHFTSVDLVKAYLARIDEVNLKGPALRAVIETNPLALQQAATSDAERKKRGKLSALHGIPIMLKDNMATLASEGMNTTSGSYALFRSVVPGDSTVAAKLRKAGAIILGKANLSEWSSIRGHPDLANGWSARGGQSTNPYYPGGDPCGSSSGSAISVAIGLAAGSLGTETHGSIICPASFNNVVGIKPTVGLTSRSGVVPINGHQDTVGPMARTVADAAAILSVIAGRDSKDNYTSTAPEKIPKYTRYLKTGAINGKRFGVPRYMFGNDTLTRNHPSISVAFESALQTIRSLGGIIVDPTDLPSTREMIDGRNERLVDYIDTKVRINAYLESLVSIPTGANNLAKVIAYNDEHRNQEEPEGYETQAVFIAAETTSGYNSSYHEAVWNNYDIGRTRGIDATMKTYRLDALVLPSDGYATTPAAIAGYPIISIPLGFHPQNTVVVPKSAGPSTVYPAPGLPFGLAFLGTAYSEPDLISFAYAYEQKTRTRMQRRAYASSIPKTQLKDFLFR